MNYSNKSLTLGRFSCLGSKKQEWDALRHVVAAAIMICAMVPAFAASTTGIETVLSNVLTMLTGPIAKSLCGIAVVITGFAWMFGYADMKKFFYVVVGSAIVFGFQEFVTMIAG